MSLSSRNETKKRKRNEMNPGEKKNEKSGRGDSGREREKTPQPQRMRATRGVIPKITDSQVPKMPYLGCIARQTRGGTDRGGG